MNFKNFRYYKNLNGFQSVGFRQGLGQAIDVSSSSTVYSVPVITPIPDTDQNLQSDLQHVGQCFYNVLGKIGKDG